MITAGKPSRLSIAQNAYNSAQTTGRKANPYNEYDQRCSWLAWEIGIYFYDSGRTMPWDISGKGYRLEINNIRFRIRLTPGDIGGIIGIHFERE